MLSFVALALLSGASAFTIPHHGNVGARVHASRVSGIQAAEKVSLDPAILDKYKALETSEVMAEYLWIDAIGEVRSKTRTLTDPKDASDVNELPDWNYDGSSTDQAPGDDSEVIIKPRTIFKDPFRGGDNILVLCDTYTPAGEPLPTNTRAPADAVFNQFPDEVPWFGLEQEYTLFNLDKATPLGWPQDGFPAAQGPYYCGVGADRSYGRSISDAHYKACLFAGIKCSGTNAEVMPGQWEFQVGPCVGIEAADHLMAARFILNRVCEDFGVYCTLHPKPITRGDWNGAGCHTNFSTKKMRDDGGYEEIVKAIRRLGGAHEKHINAYGEGNELRLTGKFETASMDKFSYGVANRGCSVRVPRSTEADNCGYFEDRRPSSNCDPYIVTSMIMDTCMNGAEADIQASNV